jgi:hypothetical protein
MHETNTVCNFSIMCILEIKSKDVKKVLSISFIHVVAGFS